MPLTDLSADALVAYRSTVTAPDDLDEFWTSTLAEARSLAVEPQVRQVDCGLRLVDTFDVTFSGHGGHPVRAWLHLPTGERGRRPLVIRYHGYGGGRGLAHEADLWALAGYATLRVDTRGQGSGWSPGDTADPEGSDPSAPGFLTRGILDPATYYFRRVFTDAVLAVDAGRALPGVDPDRIAVTGASQGGGMSIAVAGLVPDLAAVMPDVPFLQDIRHATEIAESPPYTEIAGYLKAHRDHVDLLFETLRYMDGVVLGARATAPALFSVALMDRTCPPSTVYAAYHAYGGAKQLVVYPYNDHEGGQAFQEARQLEWLESLLH